MRGREGVGKKDSKTGIKVMEEITQKRASNEMINIAYQDWLFY